MKSLTIKNIETITGSTQYALIANAMNGTTKIVHTKTAKAISIDDFPSVIDSLLENEKFKHSITDKDAVIQAAKDLAIRYPVKGEVELLSHQRDSLLTNNKSLSNKANSLADKNKSLVNKVEALDKERQELVNKSKELVSKNERLANKVEELADKNRDLANKDKSLSNKANSLADKNRDLANKVEALGKERQELVSENEKLANRANSLADKNKSLANKVANLLKSNSEFLEKNKELNVHSKELAELKDNDWRKVASNFVILPFVLLTVFQMIRNSFVLHSIEIIPNEYLNWAVSILGSFSIEAIIITLIFSGKVDVAKWFAVMSFALCMLHYQPWMYVDISDAEGIKFRNNFASTTFISLAVGIMTYMYGELFSEKILNKNNHVQTN